MELKEAIAAIEQKKKAFEALLPMKPSDEARLWQKFRLEWNYNSNHIEGNTLTYGETMLLLLKERATGDHHIREHDEMRAHDVAVDLVRKWAADKDRPLSEADIRELNRIVLVRPFWKEARTPDGRETQKEIVPGEYKKLPNHVRLPDGAVFRYAEPEEVRPMMHEMLEWYRTKAKEIHPLEVAAILHYRIVRIHPFDDGNGRVARLIMNYHLLRTSFPPVIIMSADKHNYLNALAKADTGDLPAFIQYIAEQEKWSLDLAIRAAKGEPVEEKEDWQKTVELLHRQAEVRKERKKRSIEGQKQRVVDFLSENLLTILNEYIKRLRPLGRFFQSQRLAIESKWPPFSKELPESGYLETISEEFIDLYHREGESGLLLELDCSFSGFQYSATGKVQKEAPLAISFEKKKVVMNTRVPGVEPISISYGKKISTEDLSVIKQIAEKLLGQIATAVNGKE